MGILAWTLSGLGTLCTVMGIITATGVIPDYGALGWMFWLVLGAILFLACIAAAIGRSALE